MAKKISKHTARRHVFSGKRLTSKGGFTKSAFMKNKHGRIVSKKQHARGGLNKWIIAVRKARKALGITGFMAIKKGTPFYKKAREFYN